MNFADVQKQFAGHLRNPEEYTAPAGVEDRRLKIYRELIFNNIEGFLSGGFPIVKSLYSQEDWRSLVRQFIVHHRSESPYFLEVSEEFLKYLQDEHSLRPCDPKFLLELAHYEWVELALDVSQESLSDEKKLLDDRELLNRLPRVSPLAWCLSYEYPVHLIGPEYTPQEAPKEPTFLIVYRNRAQEVHFMSSNAMTIRLLNLLSSGDYTTGQEALLQLALEMHHEEPEALVSMGLALLNQLYKADILL